LLVAGSDIWLNTPLRPFEASGTSGMKAAINGVANLSVMDGWWIEGCVEGQTGWAIGGVSESENGNDALSLYQKLECDALPMYYERRSDWVKMMKICIQKNGTFFNSHRMMRRYVCEAYL
jgi:starch phosphorylase